MLGEGLLVWICRRVLGVRRGEGGVRYPNGPALSTRRSMSRPSISTRTPWFSSPSIFS